MQQRAREFLLSYHHGNCMGRYDGMSEPALAAFALPTRFGDGLVMANAAPSQRMAVAVWQGVSPLPSKLNFKSSYPRLHGMSAICETI